MEQEAREREKEKEMAKLTGLSNSEGSEYSEYCMYFPFMVSFCIQLWMVIRSLYCDCIAKIFIVVRRAINAVNAVYMH